VNTGDNTRSAGQDTADGRSEESCAMDQRAKPPHLRNPAVLEVERKRAADFQLRLADRITGFAGSMRFVYLHATWFAVWMLFLEDSPWPTLTLIVSLEAIFLSTFVMIGQNRQADIAQRKADHDYEAQELELERNTHLTEAVHQLTTQIHASIFHTGDPGSRAAE
jgi:uncharacterized membrane protein